MSATNTSLTSPAGLAPRQGAMMMAELGLFDAIYTARALRRLKPDPVPDELITKVLDAAIRAPSGGNAQNWIFLVVRDPEQRLRLGAVYRKASEIGRASCR